MAKPRLDLLLFERGLVESRELGQRLIRAGKVRVNGQVASKPGQSVAEDVELTVQEPERFVSRGGYKLLGALETFPITLTDRVCLDVGSSTGGFTDCMLQFGARKVFAVDVGLGQLNWRLRNDDRVVVMEQKNARYLTPEELDEVPGFASCDASFISLTKLLPAMTQVLAPGGEMLTLIKPQFEAGREKVGKGGVVRDPQVHQEVIASVRAFGENTLGLTWNDVVTSPLKGPKGNVEFLAWWKKPA
ncbi:MAG: 23S rRNA (cytidine1920-2'-O)/16S rRNA (cytidine1409-2'-O)-methyltransferase [Kiritimatiellia bacterium]|jgi:23S rRNA (cytidine1920-2'-O)/16S rRNA (cytidine1409-2'-O)-methyltransferase